MNQANLIAMFDEYKKPASAELSVEETVGGSLIVMLASGEAQTRRVLTVDDIVHPLLRSKVEHMCEAHHHLAANL